jgi:arsenite-transporting ATPase
LGQLSGLESRKAVYKQAVETLADGKLTTLILVSRPEETPLKEAERASKELADIGILNQTMIINGVLSAYDDSISKGLYRKQQQALANMPESLKKFVTYTIPLRAYSITGMKNVRAFFTQDNYSVENKELHAQSVLRLKDVINDLYRTHKKVIFAMGKGGVGKTTVAAAIALGLSAKGCRTFKVCN